MRQDTKLRILRRCIFAAAIITVFLLQSTASYVSYSFPFPTGLLLPLTVSAAMAEREYAGLCFGLLAGVLTDTVSTVTDGVFTLYYAVIACAAGLLAHYVFRNTVLTAMLFTAVSGTAYCFILLIFNCLIHDASYAGELLRGDVSPLRYSFCRAHPHHILPRSLSSQPHAFTGRGSKRVLRANTLKK